jgi:hypothetical protein
MKPPGQPLRTSVLFDHHVRHGREVFRSTSLAAASRAGAGSRWVGLRAIHARIARLVAVTEAGGVIAADQRNHKQSGSQHVINRAHEQSILYRLRRPRRQNVPEPHNNRARCKVEKLPTRSQLSSSRPTVALDRIARGWLRQAVKPGNVYRPDCNRHHARIEWMQ